MPTFTFGDRTAAPPAFSPSIIEQQRAANKIARLLRSQFPSKRRFSIEAQFTPSTTRLVVHYGAQRVDEQTVELDFTVGDPLDDSGWIREMATLILLDVNKDVSNFYIAHDLDFYHISDENEHCLYEFGRAVE